MQLFCENVHISRCAKQKLAQYLPVPSFVSDPGLPPKWKVYRFAINKANSYVDNAFERYLVNIELGNRHIEKSRNPFQYAYVTFTLVTPKI